MLPPAHASAPDECICNYLNTTYLYECMSRILQYVIHRAHRIPLMYAARYASATPWGSDLLVVNRVAIASPDYAFAESPKTMRHMPYHLRCHSYLLQLHFCDYWQKWALHYSAGITSATSAIS